MNVEMNGIPVYYEIYGEGVPVLCIHGYWVDHRLMSGCLEPVFEQIKGYQRIYLDMPGFGQTPSNRLIKDANDMIEFIKQFIDIVIGNHHFLLIGESFGGYLSMGLIYEMAEKIDGLMLICPLTVYAHIELPKKEIIYQSEELKNSEDVDVISFLDMAVVATPEIYKKYKDDILAGILTSDKEYLSNYFYGRFHADYEASIKDVIYAKPSCILTGRQDHVLGFSSAYQMLPQLPRATFAIVDCAGHNLQIDNVELFNQMVKDWIWRVEM